MGVKLVDIVKQNLINFICLTLLVQAVFLASNIYYPLIHILIIICLQYIQHNFRCYYDVKNIKLLHIYLNMKFILRLYDASNKTTSIQEKMNYIVEEMKTYLALSGVMIFRLIEKKQEIKPLQYFSNFENFDQELFYTNYSKYFDSKYSELIMVDNKKLNLDENNKYYFSNLLLNSKTKGTMLLSHENEDELSDADLSLIKIISNILSGLV